MGLFQQAVGQSGLAGVNMGDNTKITYAVGGHDRKLQLGGNGAQSAG